MRLLLAILLLVAVVFGAPAPSVEDTLKALQEQVALLQKEVQGKNEQPQLAPSAEEIRRWQPEKRMVAWQPMKRTLNNVDERAPLLHAIEGRLSEVLRAGERLGVSADEVLADLRLRNNVF